MWYSPLRVYWISPSTIRIRSSLVLVAGNWKMFKGPSETAAFLDVVTDGGKKLQ